MQNVRTYLACWLGLVILSTNAQADILIDFEELTTYSATGGTGSFYDGRNPALGATYSINANWTSKGATFNLDHSAGVYTSGGIDFPYDAWSGWAYSNVTDPTTPDFGNQFAAFPGSGALGSSQYAISYPDSYINLPTNTTLKSLYYTTTTYSALYARDGLGSFGGVPFNSSDFLRVSFVGWTGANGTGSQTGSTTVSLAEGPNPISAWQFLDLSSLNSALLGNAKSLTVTYSSSDDFAPTYVAIDNLLLQSAAAVPEPSSLALIGCAVGAALWRNRRRRLKSFPKQ